MLLKIKALWEYFKQWRVSSSKMIVRESQETFRLRHWRQFVDETRGMVSVMSASKHIATNYWKRENFKEHSLLTWQLLPLYSQDPYHVWNWSGIPPLTTTHLVHRSHFTLFNRQKCFQLTSDPYYHTRKKGTQAAHIPNSWGLFSTGQSTSSHCCQLLQEFPTRIKREINPLMVNCQNQVILKTDILKVNVSATEAPTRNRGTWLRTGKRYHCLV